VKEIVTILKKKYKCLKVEVFRYVTPFSLVDGYLSHYGDSLRSQVQGILKEKSEIRKLAH